MSYTKHNFVNGATIYATPFNEMENQIVTNEANIANGAAVDAALKTFMTDFKALLNDLAYTTQNSCASTVSSDADAVIAAIDGGQTVYTVTKNLTHCTISNNASSVAQGSSYTATITAEGGYDLVGILVTMGGTNISSTAVDADVITVSNVTGNIVINAIAREVLPNTCTVTKNLTHATVSNNATYIEGGSSYTATVAAETGYTLGTVTVTMDGTDVTASAYSNGSISIASVTGDIVITATATASVYSVTKNLTDCSSSNSAATATYGTSYTTTLSTAKYYLTNVSVIMGGTDITSSAYNASTDVISILCVIGNIVITAVGVDENIEYPEHTVTKNLTHATVSNNTESVVHETAYTATVAAETGYTLGTVTVAMGGTDITSTAYSNGSISIASVTGDIVITATATANTYTVTKNLTHATVSNNASSAAHGSAYSVTISPESGYAYSGITVTVTMGGTDITSTAYVSGTRTVSIASVTGNIVITAAATVRSYTYTTNLTNCAVKVNGNAISGSGTITEGSSYNWTLEANSGYEISSVTVTMGGTDITSTAWNSTTGAIAFTASGNLVITATATASVYSITKNLYNCTLSNAATTAASGSTYTTNVQYGSDYELLAITVTMGGTNISSTAVDGDVITVSNVTGNIVISAVARSVGPELASISASFNSGGNAITEYDTLNSLKQYLTVTASYDDSSTSTVNSGDYTLSGTLAVGTSTITVSYSGKTTTFTVTVSVLNTEPVIIENDACWSTTGESTAKAGHSRTKLYEYDIDLSALRASSKYDATNGYMTANASVFDSVYYFVNTNSVSSSGLNKNVIFIDNTYIGYMSVQTGGEKSFYDPKENTGMLSGSRMKLGFTVYTAGIDDSYAYFKSSKSGVMPIGVNNGDIIFAGRNTPYYGKKNISEVSAT